MPRLFVADSDNNTIWEIDPDGADTEGTIRVAALPFLTGTGLPLAMTVLENRLLVIENRDGLAGSLVELRLID